MQFRRGGVFVLVLGAALAAGRGDDLSPDLLLLTRFKQKIRQDLARIPNYTCLETIVRSQRGAAAHSFKPIDTIRLEVSNIDGNELFAWPGGRSFVYQDPSSIVSHGAISNGIFALSARELFVADLGTFQNPREEMLEGRRTIRYDYLIPQLVSGFTIRTDVASAVVGSSGSFWFDPVSLDLIRLDKAGEQIPRNLDLQSTTLRIQYARIHLGSTEVLLPQSAELVMTRLAGAVERNAIEFSGCHQYSTESIIRFDDAAPAAAAPQTREVDLPAGMLVRIALESAVESRTASIGDTVRARVTREVRRGEDLVLPSGAVVTGHIRRMERQEGGDPYTVMGIELSDIEWPGSHADFYGQLVESYGKREIAGNGSPGAATFIVSGKNARLTPGFELLWRKLDRPAAPVQQPR